MGLAIAALTSVGVFNVGLQNAFAFSAVAHPETSVMTLEVKSVVKSPKKAEQLKKDLSGLKGVKDVSVCTQSGTVKISYVKSELGCCSAIHAALKDQGWKYTMVSNEEKPACTKEQMKVCPGARQQQNSCGAAKKDV
ncbi:MAG: hypothetical protein RMM53_02285 [Bacteroidia bacterium]|nr:hypothetical protein [Bacteroidia bacterium]